MALRKLYQLVCCIPVSAVVQRLLHGQSQQVAAAVANSRRVQTAVLRRQSGNRSRSVAVEVGVTPVDAEHTEHVRKSWSQASELRCT